MISIYMADLYHDYQPTRQYVPLGIGYIGSYLKSRFGSDIDVKLFKSVDKFLDSIKARRPDLIGMTNYTWNNGLNNFAGKLIKETEGDIPIVREFMALPQERRSGRDLRQIKTMKSYAMVDGRLVGGTDNSNEKDLDFVPSRLSLGAYKRRRNVIKCN